MAKEADFDTQKIHHHFAAECFNKAWELIEKPDRTPADDEQMVRLTQASLWHWTQRDDCTPTNMSIGYWQASRVYAILGRAEEARRYGRLCLDTSPQDAPFFLAYAHEALARAEKAAGNQAQAERHYAQAMALAENVAVEDRKQLLNDLKTIADHRVYNR